MVFGFALGAASIGLGYYQSEQNRKAQEVAERRNLLQMERARRQSMLALDENAAARDETLAEIDAANELIASIAPQVLGNLDEQQRVIIARQIVQQQEDNARLNQRLMQSGLDSTTVASQVTQQQDMLGGRTTAEMATGFAGLRAQVQMQATQLEAQGMMRRAGAIERFNAQRASIRQNFGNLESSFQFAPAYDNTAGAIGAGLGSLANLVSSYGGGGFNLGNLFGGGSSRRPTWGGGFAVGGGPTSGAAGSGIGGVGTRNIWDGAVDVFFPSDDNSYLRAWQQMR